MIKVVDLVGPVLDLARQVRLVLDRMTAPSVAGLRAELEKQYGDLIHPGFVADTGADRLPRLAVYLRAMLERAQKAPGDLARDEQRQDDVDHVRTELDKLLAGLPAGRLALDEDRPQALAGAVDRRRQARGAAADDTHRGGGRNVL